MRKPFEENIKFSQREEEIKILVKLELGWVSRWKERVL